KEVRYQMVHTEDAEILLVAYGLAARVCHRAVELARHHGIAAGLLRPITLFPYPTEIVHQLGKQVDHILVVEMNSGQMIEDVRLAVDGAVSVDFFGRMGGIIPSPEEVVEKIASMMKTQQHYEESHV